MKSLLLKSTSFSSNDHYAWLQFIISLNLVFGMYPSIQHLQDRNNLEKTIALRGPILFRRLWGGIGLYETGLQSELRKPHTTTRIDRKYYKD